MDIGETFAGLIGLIFGTYILYVFVTQMSQTDPGFALTGWLAIIGFIAAVSFGLYKTIT